MGVTTALTVEALAKLVLARMSAPELQQVIKQRVDFDMEGRSLVVQVEGARALCFRVKRGRMEFVDGLIALPTATVTLSDTAFWNIYRGHLTPWTLLKHGEITWAASDGQWLRHALLLMEAFDFMRKLVGI